MNEIAVIRNIFSSKNIEEYSEDENGSIVLVPKRNNGGYIHQKDACRHSELCKGCKSWFCQDDELFSCVSCLTSQKICNSCYGIGDPTDWINICKSCWYEHGRPYVKFSLKYFRHCRQCDKPSRTYRPLKIPSQEAINRPFADNIVCRSCWIKGEILLKKMDEELDNFKILLCEINIKNLIYAVGKIQEVNDSIMSFLKISIMSKATAKIEKFFNENIELIEDLFAYDLIRCFVNSHSKKILQLCKDYELTNLGNFIKAVLNKHLSGRKGPKTTIMSEL